jgi:hypothetical protein
MSEVERRLRGALVPVEPPWTVADGVERRLTELADAAVEELADWELATMRDPRNWARPAAALVIGSAAGGALVVVRARQRQRAGSARRSAALQQTVRAATGDVRRRLGRHPR